MSRKAAATMLALAMAAGASVAGADTVYKCMAGTRTIYQQTPCAKDQRQQAIRLPDTDHVDGQAVPVPTPAPAHGDAEAASPPPDALPPPPRMYGCVRATDGKPYTSANGNPEPYMAPLGVLGAVSQPLGDTYGRPGAAVASAPELNRGKGNAAAVATRNYVWVQDSCRELSPAETCRVLRDEAEATQRQIRNAFRSERGPLDAKDARLRAQMQGCG